MNLPKEFKFTTRVGTYKAQAVGEFYEIRHESEDFEDTPNWDTARAVETIKEYFSGGAWKMVTEVEGVNGVDALGNPREWHDSDFEPYQYVVTRNGREWIVCQGLHGHGLVLVGEGGFLYAQTKYENDPHWDAVEVYSIAEYNGALLDFSIQHRELLWKEAEVSKEVEEFAARVAYFENNIAAVEENLQSLKKELQNLRDENNNKHGK